MDEAAQVGAHRTEGVLLLVVVTVDRHLSAQTVGADQNVFLVSKAGAARMLVSSCGGGGGGGLGTGTLACWARRGPSSARRARQIFKLLKKLFKLFK
jgi:hypothetical protein